MATQSWGNRIRHDSDAAYQEWRDEFLSKLGSLLGVAETNITPGAGSRPTDGITEQGYAVFYLNDSLHATAPIYMRFSFIGFTIGPVIRCTVGTSTNGSGVIGGTALSTSNVFINPSSGQTTDVPYPSYACAVEGFFGLGWKLGSTSDGCFIVCRTCDNDGQPTAEGSLVHWGAGSASTWARRQSFRYAAPAAAYAIPSSIAAGTLGFAPMAQTNTLVSGAIQIFLGWTISPRASPLFGLCGVYPNELPVGTTFEAILVGQTTRTFVALNTLCGPFGPLAANASPGGVAMAMLWE